MKAKVKSSQSEAADWADRLTKADKRQRDLLASGGGYPAGQPQASGPGARPCHSCGGPLAAGWTMFCHACLDKHTGGACPNLGSPSETGEPDHCQMGRDHKGPCRSSADLRRERDENPSSDLFDRIFWPHDHIKWPLLITRLWP